MRMKDESALWALAFVWAVFAGAVWFLSPLGEVANLLIIAVVTPIMVYANVEF